MTIASFLDLPLGSAGSATEWHRCISVNARCELRHDANMALTGRVAFCTHCLLAAQGVARMAVLCSANVIRLLAVLTTKDVTIERASY